MSETTEAERGVAALLASLGEKHAGGGSWTHAAADASLRLTVCSAASPGLSARAFRGEILLPYSCATIVARTLALEERCTWDRAIARLAVHMVRAPHHRVFYSVTRPAAGGIISGRDFADAVFVGSAAALPPAVAAAAVRPLASGAFVNAGAGLREHAAFPASSALVRGYNHPSGWVLEPAQPPPAGDGGRAPPSNSNGWTRVSARDAQGWAVCLRARARRSTRHFPRSSHHQVTYLVQPELAGWLPTSVVNASLSSMFSHFFSDMLAHLQTLPKDALESEASLL